MKHIVVDLEMNNIRRRSEARKICTNEIIEIGASMLDENLWEIGKFQIYVKPEYNDVIVPKISKLTGITNEMVANAPTFSVAFKQFTDWCLNIKDDVMIYAWSNTDHSQVMKEIQLKQYKLSEEEHKLMEHGWTDFQNEFDIHLGFERQISLKLALDMAGIDFNGRQHDALDDARNTAKLLRVFKDEELFDQTLRKIEEVMKPSSLENTLGNLIDLSMFMTT
ncbi:exonuclease domain-containing protein [Anaerostipes hadrus]|jgi:inhibitor of KinA sporulation pathway (predicted exonuclease)|uniref:3'-5' exonuclease n=2 Tax=Anaerostipes TaxID=207244 RepID=A0ABV1ISL2_9FIRM|nr:MULTISPECIES: 3'-5' exonuclease [Bacillota]MCO7162507.1 exonuclease domain-containing protein [Anaerostipes hadrus]MCU6780250.1 exonuclease domain-containing protein [Anaerostipes amylophilus]CDD72277.1 dNA polymerase III epsilon subunit-like 3'-5' exonuclease [Firmicutes bacterium CAG:270]CUN39970.1 sporulation inhibitor KapD [Anaerostipes hadrus]